MASRPGGGNWAPVCVDHTYIELAAYVSPSFRVPASSEFSIDECLKRWMSNSDDPYAYKHYDKENWPSNKPCSGEI